MRFCKREGCGTPLTGKQRLWCSDACRKRVERKVDKQKQAETSANVRAAGANRVEGRRYYVRESFNWPEWTIICQKKNNVVVCESPEWEMAMVIFEQLEALPAAKVPFVKGP